MAESGSGPTLVKAANWLTHLEYEWESPVWKHWIRFYSANTRFIRYDERGCGMSDLQLGTLTLDQWTEDLASIVNAGQPAGPVTLLGISQGAAACIRFAIEHPERVSRMILYDGYAHGPFKRGTPGPESTYGRPFNPATYPKQPFHALSLDLLLCSAASATITESRFAGKN